MFNVGPLELIVVLIIALLVLGPQRLPEVARSVGRGLREFRNSIEGGGDDEDDEYDEPPASPQAIAEPEPVADKPVEVPKPAEKSAPEPPV